MSQASKRRRAEAKRQKELAARPVLLPNPIDPEFLRPLENDPCPNLYTDPHKIAEDIRICRSSRYPLTPELRTAMILKLTRIMMLNPKDRTVIMAVKELERLDAINVRSEDYSCGRIDPPIVQVNVQQNTAVAVNSQPASMPQELTDDELQRSIVERRARLAEARAGAIEVGGGVSETPPGPPDAT